MFVEKEVPGSTSQRPLKRHKKTFEPDPPDKLGLEESTPVAFNIYVNNQRDMILSYLLSHHHSIVTMANVLHQWLSQVSSFLASWYLGYFVTFLNFIFAGQQGFLNLHSNLVAAIHQHTKDATTLHIVFEEGL